LSNTSSNIDLAFLTADNLDLQKTQEKTYKNFDHHFLAGALPPATALFPYNASSHVQTINMPTFPAVNDAAYVDYFESLVNTSD
jgi:hypothetical protein